MGRKKGDVSKAWLGIQGFPSRESVLGYLGNGAGADTFRLFLEQNRNKYEGTKAGPIVKEVLFHIEDGDYYEARQSARLEMEPD
ncbi:MAG: hypothetical protein ACLFU1_00875 [Alphaproteobacteria bacterium]